MMRSYRRRVALALCSIPSQTTIGPRDWGFLTVRGWSDTGDHRFVPGLSELWMYARISDPGIGSYRPRVTPISDRPLGLGFPHRAGRF